MPGKDDDLLKRLLATFKVEAQEHIQTIASGLVGLEKASTEEAQASILDVTFRSAHSLKGAARTVNAADIESLCQSLESVFAAMKRREIAPARELFDLLHQVVDGLSKLLPFIDAAPSAAQKSRVIELAAALHAVLAEKLLPGLREPAGQPPNILAGTMAEAAQAIPEEKRALVDTVRVASA